MPNPQSPIFSTAVATDLDLMVASNRALSKITYPIDSTQTSFTVIDGSKFEIPCIVQIDTEIIRVADKSGNVLQTCTRGFGNTANANHGQNADVKGYVLSYHHNQLAAEIKAIEAGLGPGFGNVVMQIDEPGAGSALSGVFSNLQLKANGVSAGSYGGFNTDVVITVDNTGRVTSIADSVGNINYPIIYKAAIAQGSNAVLGFSFGDTDAPTGVVYIGTSGLCYAVASFTQGNEYWVQDHFYLPDDWPGVNGPNNSGIVSLDIYWRTAATTGNVTWKVRTGYLRDGVGPDITWNSYKATTTTVPAVADKTVKTRITPVYMTNFQAGDELFFQFARDAADTAAAPAELISIKFNINRDFALVQ